MLPGKPGHGQNPKDAPLPRPPTASAGRLSRTSTGHFYNLALALSCQRKNSEAVYEFQRSAVLDRDAGRDHQPDPGKIKTFADNAYTKVTAPDEGLAQLKDQVKSAPLWPAGFHIKTAHRDCRREAEGIRTVKFLSSRCG